MDLIKQITIGSKTYGIGIPSGLTAAQQEAIRNNIGALSEVDVSVVADGTYPNMTVGQATKAIQDESGNNITDTYSKQLGSYPNMTVGKATDADTLDGKHASEFATAAQGVKADNALPSGNLLDKTYPIGAVYISYVSTSPASLFGGTWTQIQGRFLLAASSAYSAGSTGGSATHTLTVNEMPAHNHANNYYNNEVPAPSGSDWVAPGNRDSDVNVVNTTSTTGGGQPHNNMPPYLAVYMWRRTA